MAIQDTLDRLRIQQVMLANGIGVTTNSVCSWAQGKRQPSGQNASDMLAFLRRYDPDLDLEDLIPSAIGEAMDDA